MMAADAQTRLIEAVRSALKEKRIDAEVTFPDGAVAEDRIFVGVTDGWKRQAIAIRGPFKDGADFRVDANLLCDSFNEAAVKADQ